MFSHGRDTWGRDKALRQKGMPRVRGTRFAAMRKGPHPQVRSLCQAIWPRARLVLDLDGANGAGVGAGTAANAVVLVGGDGDVVNLDDAHGATVGASATSDAGIGVNDRLGHVKLLSKSGYNSPIQAG